MFVELIDLLRCPLPHEDSWLVLAAVRTEDRHVLDGTLGCPVCRAEYPVHKGVADLRPPGEHSPPPTFDVPDADEEMVVMLAAMAGLSEHGGTVAIGGSLANAAAGLESIANSAVLIINPSAGWAPAASALRCAGPLPVAPDGLRALVLDDMTAAAVDLNDAVRRVRVGGRIVAPATLSLPDGMRELARDANWWVAERESPRIALRRA